MMHRGSNKSVM